MEFCNVVMIEAPADERFRPSNPNAMTQNPNSQVTGHKLTEA